MLIHHCEKSHIPLNSKDTSPDAPPDYSKRRIFEIFFIINETYLTYNILLCLEMHSSKIEY